MSLGGLRGDVLALDPVGKNFKTQKTKNLWVLLGGVIATNHLRSCISACPEPNQARKPERGNPVGPGLVTLDGVAARLMGKWDNT